MKGILWLWFLGNLDARRLNVSSALRRITVGYWLCSSVSVTCEGKMCVNSADQLCYMCSYSPRIVTFALRIEQKEVKFRL